MRTLQHGELATWREYRIVGGKSIVYSPAARKSVNSGIKLNKWKSSYEKRGSMVSGMISAPPFGGSHPVPKWED